MEAVFAALTILLFALVIGVFASITRDVWPLLTDEERSTFRTFFNSPGRQRNRAIDRAWNEHVRTFPRSRKRALFAILLVVASLSVVGYPIWQTFYGR